MQRKHKKNGTTAAVLRAIAFVPVVMVYVCVVGAQQEMNHDNISTPNATIKFKPANLIRGCRRCCSRPFLTLACIIKALVAG